MRHRKRGRRLGRSSSHRKAMYRNMASSLFLTYRGEEVAEVYGYERKQPAGRIVTTLEKAKEVRSLVEKCITIARKAKPHREASEAIVAPSRAMPRHHHPSTRHPSSSSSFAARAWPVASAT